MAASVQGRQWNLKECVDYAVAHNITIRQKANERQQRSLQLSTNRNSRLPDLNASVGQNFSFGRGLTSENTYSNTNTSSTQFGLSTSVSLFDGGKTTQGIRQSQLNLEAATADLEKAKNDIRVSVAEAYVQILYKMEIADVARRQIGIDSMQVVRIEALCRNGKASQAELSEQQATLAQSRVTLMQADNDYRLAVLALSQLLELPSPDGFTIARPTEEEVDCMMKTKAEAGNTLSPDAIYAEAIGVKPEVAAEQLRLESAGRAISIARAGRYPQLSLSAGLGSNYYTTSGFRSDSFTRQLKNNFSQYVGLNLSIPLFNRFATRNSIRMAEIDRDNQQLQLDNVKKTLYKEIQQVYYNTLAATSKYAGSREAYRSCGDAFALMKAKYENGKANITEFNTSKNNLLKAQSDMLQAKYECVYQYALTDFYRGHDLSL